VGWRVCGQRLAQGVERGAAVGLGGADDGAEGGIGLGARLRAEAVGDFAEDHARPQRPFGDADEQVLTIAGDTAAQPLGGGTASGQGQHPIEPAVELGTILPQCAVAQLVASPGNGDGAQQQALERWREPLVAAVDGILRIAQQMGAGAVEEPPGV